MCPCGSGLGVLTGEREAPALQRSLLLPATSKQGRGALCLLIPTSPLPELHPLSVQLFHGLKLGAGGSKEGPFSWFPHPGWSILPGLTMKVF